MRMQYVTIAALVLLMAIQLVPVDRSNPPVSQDVAAPDSVKTILRRACYDCHSNETVWPWYAHIAPVSLLVAHDVSEGREHLNFSTWDKASTSPKFGKLLDEVIEVIEEGEMPLWFYLPLHPQAALTDADRSALIGWAAGLGGSIAHVKGEEGDSDSDD